jgi:catechol 2,3-dioxygenase-like lactoylglutathione lyase family enzyme
MLKFDVIHLKSRDVDAAVAWYQKMLGAEIIDRFENERGKTVMTKLTGTAINITQHDDANSLPSVPLDRFNGIEHIGFEVDDLERNLEELKSKGAEIITPIESGNRQNRWFFVRAPDGVRIEMCEYGH